MPDKTRSAAVRRGFFCVPDESGGVADTPWVFCAACGRTVAAVERATDWWCAGCGERLAVRPVLDRDPGDEQPDAA